MSAKEYPLVSVLMTAYNRQKFIVEAIDSVLASEYTNFELVIVDDGSTDNTVPIARGYAQKDSRIHLHINEKNLGDYPNRNKAVSHARGEYIMFCDSDDRFFPDTLSYCVEAMERFPVANAGLYYAGKAAEPFMLENKTVILRHFFEYPVLTIGPGGSILKRNFLLSIGGYPEKYGPANDMYFNLKACSKSNIVFLPKLFLDYRLHEHQEQKNTYSYIYNNYRYLDDALHELNLPLTASQMNFLQKKNKRRFSVNLLRYFGKTGNFHATRQLWRNARFDLKSFLTGIFHFN